jgi:hypothetical protein
MKGFIEIKPFQLGFDIEIKYRCMNILKIIKLVLLFMTVSCTVVFAQSRMKSNEKERPEYDRGATYEIESSKKTKKKKAKYSLAGEYDKKVEEYHQRMEANVKKYKKMAKEMEKPQYSDPAYFGHKKKPKKRPNGKKKFCKECGLYH